MSTLLQLDDPICKPGSGHLLKSMHPTVKDVRTWCPGIMLHSSCSDDTIFDSCCERPIGDLELNAPHLVGFFRQPEVRIMSDWNLNVAHGKEAVLEMEPKQYGQLVQGCTVKMLTRQMDSITLGPGGGYHCADGSEPPTWAQVDRALDRLQNDFIFIGMTDDWDLSICLFNAMFGNACHNNQFAKLTGSAQTSSTNSSDVSPLDGFVDSYDAVLWEAAQRIFQENLLRFNVSKEKCHPC